jgi:hypothetical protein
LDGDLIRTLSLIALVFTLGLPVLVLCLHFYIVAIYKLFQWLGVEQ